MKKSISRKQDLLITIIATLMVLFITDHYLFGLAVVKGESMYPTINPYERLVYIKTPYFYKNPQRGDIIIFQPPDELGRETLFVKRVIATESDCYIIDNGILTVNEIEIKETYICNGLYLDKNYPYTEGVVPKDQVFVLGDNRNNSKDSRRFSCVEIGGIKGKVVIRIWPLNEIRIFTNPFA